MISALLTLAVAAAPIDCKADLDCFRQTLRTCGPARYADTNLDRLEVGHKQGIVPVGATEFSVSVGKDEVCNLTVHNRVEAIELSARIVSGLGRGVDKRKTAELLAAQDKGVLRQCAMTAEQIKKALEQQKIAGYTPADWAACKPLGCQSVLPADKGCAWSDCKDATRTLTCGEEAKALRCAPWDSAAAQKPGRESLLQREHLTEERPCVASCKAAGAEPEAVCR
jgi:hypothetical protein